MEAEKTRKTNIEEKISKLKELEKKLRWREKQASQKQLLDIGKLAEKTEIAKLDHKVLVGAFMEIFEKSSDNNIVAGWLKKSEEINRANPNNRLILSFHEPISEEVKDKLKSTGFRWNKFRCEYYGFGEKLTISSLLKGIDFKLEEIQ